MAQPGRVPKQVDKGPLGPTRIEDPIGPGDARGCPEGMVCDGPRVVAPPPPSMLPPSIGEKRCLDCPLPRLPPAYRQLGIRQEMLIKICADRQGTVRSCDHTSFKWPQAPQYG